ncbi:Serine carboxypeptidase-like, partial [Thalictrum thalictroides]
TLSQTIIKCLPGFDGELPFELETGYVSVDENDDAQYFYYFVKSERNPREDPLILWFDGGPGCSALCGFAFEIGPINFAKQESNGSLPSLVLNPYSWTKVSNVLFVDSPIGAGFSYSKTLQGSYSSDTIFAKQVYIFLKKWFIGHPDFLQNPLYIASLSYSGLIIPVIAQVISDGNEASEKPFVNLKFTSLSCCQYERTRSIDKPQPRTDRHVEENSQVQFAHRMGIISDELYESVKKNCREEYVNVDPSNSRCLKDIQAFKEFTSDLNTYHILEPYCLTELIEPDKMKRERIYVEAFPTLDSLGYPANNLVSERPMEGDDSLETNYATEIPLSPPLPKNPVHECRNYGYKHAYYWANNLSVQKALHVQQGTVKEWIRCNLDIPYYKEFTNTVSYYIQLSAKGYRSLIYNGDHDMMIPFVGTQEWIRSLNFSIEDEWRPWYVNGQVAGYTRMYSNNLTFATVKGGGHEVPMYKPKECLAMLERWISHNPL